MTAPGRTEGPKAPVDPVGGSVAAALRDLLYGASAEMTYVRTGAPGPDAAGRSGEAVARGPGPTGWDAVVTVRLQERLLEPVETGNLGSLEELLSLLPVAGLRAAGQLRSTSPDPIPPALDRAVRDTVAAEVLGAYLGARLASDGDGRLMGEAIEYLVELSGSRVEAHDLTHGIVVTDALSDRPRIELRYPHDLRAAKRAPLLFDGQRSVLVVDPSGRARTELQRHRIARLGERAPARATVEGWLDSGWLVAEATRVLGGVGMYVRGDRSIWTFVDGQPLLVRRGEHWTAFPVELAAAISQMIGGGEAAELVARAAFMISSQPHGAILAIVDSPDSVGPLVAPKDRYDLRDDIDPLAARPETRLHHLIDAGELDEFTLARLASLDGATVLDRHGRLLAYGAIVASAHGEHEGARTAAARSLSEAAAVVLKVSMDGDITVFRSGDLVTTLLGHPPHFDSQA